MRESHLAGFRDEVKQRCVSKLNPEGNSWSENVLGASLGSSTLRFPDRSVTQYCGYGGTSVTPDVRALLTRRTAVLRKLGHIDAAGLVQLKGKAACEVGLVSCLAQKTDGHGPCNTSIWSS